MRPDRVYRTSVLAPMMNYSPQADVQAVAYAFTQGPPLGTQLQGLGGATLGDKVRAFFARFKKSQPMMAQQPILQTVPPPAAAAAMTVAPQMQPQMSMLMRLSHNGMQPDLQRAANALSRRRYLTFYKAG